MHYGAGEAHPLLHAATQFRDAVVAPLQEPYQAHDFRDAFRSLCTVTESVNPRKEIYVLGDGKLIVE